MGEVPGVSTNFVVKVAFMIGILGEGIIAITLQLEKLRQQINIVVVAVAAVVAAAIVVAVVVING